MKTITNIIETENQVLEAKVLREYNERKSKYDNQLISLKKECSDKKWRKYDNEKEILKLQEAYTIKEKNHKNQKEDHEKDLILIAFMLIFCFALLGSWWGFSGWRLFFSIIGSFFMGMGCIWLLELFSLYPFLSIFLEDPLPNYLPERILTDISNFKKSNEKLTIEISKLEDQLKSLQENLPKIKDVEKIYNTKDFFNKISTDLSRMVEFNIQSLIGLNIKSKQVQEFLSGLGVKPEISKHDDCYYYVFKSLGFDILFLKSDVIEGFFLYSEDKDKHSQYHGIIPYNIHFNDSSIDVEQKLGLPDENGGDGVYGYWSSWRINGVHISYKEKNNEDILNNILDMRFFSGNQVG